MRRMYSLRQEASAVSRVKARVSDLICSEWVSELSDILSEEEMLSLPGKNREKAIRQAWGVVIKLWKRRETRETSDREVGGRCDNI